MPGRVIPLRDQNTGDIEFRTIMGGCVVEPWPVNTSKPPIKPSRVTSMGTFNPGQVATMWRCGANAGFNQWAEQTLPGWYPVISAEGIFAAEIAQGQLEILEALLQDAELRQWIMDSMGTMFPKYMTPNQIRELGQAFMALSVLYNIGPTALGEIGIVLPSLTPAGASILTGEIASVARNPLTRTPLTPAQIQALRQLAAGSGQVELSTIVDILIAP